MSSRPETLEMHQEQGAPRIDLPVDEGWVDLLKEKREQYKLRQSRLASGPRLRYQDPELRARNLAATQTGYALEILGRLIDDGSVDTQGAWRELSDSQGESFDERRFNKGCTIVEEYAKNQVFLLARVISVREQNID